MRSASAAAPLRLWLDATPRPGATQMAIDAVLLARAGGGALPVLRLYRWDPPCLSFGRHEPALRRYDRAAIEALGLDTVRRPTGGRAVWHHDELTYAWAAPDDRADGLRQAYRRLHELVADAVSRLGGAPTLAPAPARAQDVGAGACFAAPAGGEVLLGGRKVAGSAQLREAGGILQHGSLLLGGSQAIVARVTRGTLPAAADTSLAEALGRRVAFEDAAEAVAGAAAASHAVVAALPEAEAASILAEAAHAASRFRDAEWTWRR